MGRPREGGDHRVPSELDPVGNPGDVQGGILPQELRFGQAPDLRCHGHAAGVAGKEGTLQDGARMESVPDVDFSLVAPEKFEVDGSHGTVRLLSAPTGLDHALRGQSDAATARGAIGERVESAQGGGYLVQTGVMALFPYSHIT